jgi:hypothetical protein
MGGFLFNCPKKSSNIMNNTYNNPVSRVKMTRTLHNGSTQGLISFNGEEPSWIAMETIDAIYSYINKIIEENQK